MAHGNPKTETADEQSDDQAPSLTRTLLEWAVASLLLLPTLSLALIGLEVFATLADAALALGLLAVGGGALVVGIAGALDTLFPPDRQRARRSADDLPLYDDRLPSHPDNPQTLPPDQVKPVRVLEPREEDLEELL